MSPTLDTIVSLCKRRGFVFQTSELYGGLTSSYDLGPLGVRLMNQIRQLWWQEFVDGPEDMVGIDSQILLHPRTWEASGHVSAFNDPLVEDKVTHKRYRADHLIEAFFESHPQQAAASTPVESMSLDDMNECIKQNGITSPDGNPITEAKAFNLLFQSAIGSVADEKSVVYLRGETAQGIFSNFKPVMDSTRVSLPFGIGQIGKSFRNEITTGQFVFRTLEFEQAEIEYFFDPNENKWEELMHQFRERMWNFVTNTLEVDSEFLRWRQHEDTERSHYSLDTYDLEYRYPFGFKELWGIAYRTDYDLTQHQRYSGVKQTVLNQETGQTLIPHVIEPALGLNRTFLMILCNAYRVDETRNRPYLALPFHLAPFQVAVFPLVKNKPELIEKAREVYGQLKSEFRSIWDDRGNIGKRYFSQDEIGTPFCVTIDYDTIETNSVTVRNRDTAEQTRIDVKELNAYLKTARV